MGQELELRWQEYYELVTMLLQWIRHHVVVFEESKFPTSYEEIEVSNSHANTFIVLYCIEFELYCIHANLVFILSYLKYLFGIMQLNNVI